MGAFAQPAAPVRLPTSDAALPAQPRHEPERLIDRVPLRGARGEVAPLQDSHDGTRTLACDCYHSGKQTTFWPVKVGHSHTALSPHRPFIGCPYPVKCGFWTWVDQLPSDHHDIASELLKTHRFCATLPPQVLLDEGEKDKALNRKAYGTDMPTYCKDQDKIQAGLRALLDGHSTGAVTRERALEAAEVALAVAYQLRHLLASLDTVWASVPPTPPATPPRAPGYTVRARRSPQPARRRDEALLEAGVADLSLGAGPASSAA